MRRLTICHAISDFLLWNSSNLYHRISKNKLRRNYVQFMSIFVHPKFCPPSEIGFTPKTHFYETSEFLSCNFWLFAMGFLTICYEISDFLTCNFWLFAIGFLTFCNVISDYQGYVNDSAVFYWNLRRYYKKMVICMLFEVSAIACYTFCQSFM